MSQPTTTIEDIFGPSGLLAEKINGYLPRSVQIEMAQAITTAFDENQVLIVEAGTGTGKTYAYLLPSLLSGKKVVISTGTKNLQDQLFFRDIPLIRSCLGLPLKIALLKGRSNYLCQQRLSTYLQSDFLADENIRYLTDLQRWSETDKEGEIEHFHQAIPDTALLPYITSTADNCLGPDCEFFAKCFLHKARKFAQEADVIIINHHLFFADSRLKESGVSDLLPNSHAIVFDEAHQLPEVATHFLGETISARQLIYLARDIEIEQHIDAPDMLDLKYNAQSVAQAVKDLAKAFGNHIKGSWSFIVHKPELKVAVQNVQKALYELGKSMEHAVVRSKGLENCAHRLSELSIQFTKLTTSFPDDQIHWYELQGTNFSIHHTPLDISHYFQRLINEEERTWIFTSATLSINGDFSHFENYLGLATGIRLQLESPFNYQKQALLYLPSIKTMPNEEDYFLETMHYVLPVLEATRGSAFFLFTSHKALKMAADYLERHVSFPLLVQGRSPKPQLLAEFNRLDHAILLGTSSFWEGIDVKGDRLSCVIIDKIPFVAPDDPILKARMDHFKRQGKQVFNEYQLPQAVIALRQGAGRLIRDIEDRGILMICDPRLTTKDYGKTFLSALPPMRITSTFQEVKEFLATTRTILE